MMRFKDSVKYFLLSAAVVCAVYVSQAHATRNMMAEGGIAWPNQNDITCFDASFGEITQTCDISNKRTVDFMLPIDSTGARTVTITTFESSGNSMTCGTFAIGQTGGGIGGASSNMPTGLGTTTLMSITVPSLGSLGATCLVPFNSGVRMMRW